MINKSKRDTTIALHKETNKIVSVKNVPNGLKCECVCLECGTELEAVANTPLAQVSAYFRHHNPTNCTISFESALHIAAKRIISNSSTIALPNSIGMVSYSDAREEVSIGKFIADVEIITSDYKKIYIEIKVSHEVEFDKIEYYRLMNTNMIEIDLSNIDRYISMIDLESLVLNEIYNKEILSWENSQLHKPLTIDKALNPNKEGEYTPWLIGLVIFLSCLGYKWTKSKKKY